MTFNVIYFAIKICICNLVFGQNIRSTVCDQTCNSEVDMDMVVPLSMDTICSVKVW